MVPIGRVVMGVILLWAVQLGCGGKAGPKVAADGRLFLQNDTSAPLRVTAYCDEVGEVKVLVEVGDKVDLFDRTLSGGTKVTLHIESVGSPEAHYEAARGHPSSQDIELTIDDNTTVRMYGPLIRAPHIDYEIRKD